ncbi:MAG: hypothetical protein D3924_06220 [Candidatus Electrothrix sp. AR4]|nr:hypothetical protein [Candidatus Electrothrix sp. AR4]
MVAICFCERTDFRLNIQGQPKPEGTPGTKGIGYWYHSREVCGKNVSRLEQQACLTDRRIILEDIRWKDESQGVVCLGLLKKYIFTALAIGRQAHFFG